MDAATLTVSHPTTSPYIPLYPGILAPNPVLTQSNGRWVFSRPTQKCAAIFRISSFHLSHSSTLEILEAQRLDEVSSRLAYHWEQAREFDPALRWHERAAVVAGLNDPQSAFAHWRKVSTCSEQLEPTSDILRANARASRAMLDIQWRMGATEVQARELYEAGMASADRARDTAMRAALTGTYAAQRGIAGGQIDAFVSMAKEATRLAEQTEDAELKHAMQNWEMWSLFFSGRHKEAIDIGTVLIGVIPEDASYGEAYVPPNLNWSVRMGASFSFGFVGDLERHLTLGHAAPRYHEGSPEWDAYLNAGMGTVASLYGQKAKALDHSTRAMEAAETSGGGAAAVAMASGAMGMYHLGAAEYEAATIVARRAIEQIKREHAAAGFISCVGGVLAEAELGMGDRAAALEYALEITEFCRAHGNHWVLTPYLALVKAHVALDEPQAARRVLDETSLLIEQGGARIWLPYLHECRADFARKFESEWSTDGELLEAQRLFDELGAKEHAKRLGLLL